MRRDAGSTEPEQKRPVRYPASLGLSVFLPPSAKDSITVRVRYADYDKVELALEHTDKKYVGWKRVPQGPVAVSVPLDAVKIGPIPVPGSRGLVIRGELRETHMKGLEAATRVLSLFLVNERTVLEKERDTSIAFRATASITRKRS